MRTPPTRWPTPMPIDSRKKSGSKKLDKKTYQILRYARTLRSTSRHGRRRHPGKGKIRVATAFMRSHSCRQPACEGPDAPERACPDAADQDGDVPHAGEHGETARRGIERQLARM